MNALCIRSRLCALNFRRNINYLVQKASGKVKSETGQKPEMRSTLVAELFLQGEKK